MSPTDRSEEQNRRAPNAASPALDASSQVEASFEGAVSSAPSAKGKLSWRQTFSALHHRNFRLFFIGQLVSLIGTWMQNTAQSWLIYQLTGSKLLLGVVAAAGTAPMLFFSLWGGSVADRHPKRAVIIITQTVDMVLAFVLAALVLFQWVQPWHIILLATLGGISLAFDMPARMAFLVEMTSKKDLLNAVSLNSSIVNGARFIGPSIAGLVMASAGMAACFFLNGLSYIAVIIGLLMMRLPKHSPPKHDGTPWEHTLEGLRYTYHHAEVSTMLLLFAVVGIFGWSYMVLMPAFAADVLKISEDAYGILLASNGFGALVGALAVAAGGDHGRPRLLIVGGLWLFAATLLLVSLTQNFYFAISCLAVGGVGMMMFFSTMSTQIQVSVPDAMRGRVMGVWALVFGGMMPLGGLEAGTLSHYVGVRWALAIGACVCGLTAFIIWVKGARAEPSAGKSISRN